MDNYSTESFNDDGIKISKPLVKGINLKQEWLKSKKYMIKIEFNTSKFIKDPIKFRIKIIQNQDRSKNYNFFGINYLFNTYFNFML